MDKPSEKKLDHKECGDTDIGRQDYKAGGCREQLNGLWGVVSEEVVGLPASRLLTNCYSKRVTGEKKDEKFSLVDDMLTHGPPVMNVSKPQRVL
jgi:hypothetical protein